MVFIFIFFFVMLFFIVSVCFSFGFLFVLIVGAGRSVGWLSICFVCANHSFPHMADFADIDSSQYLLISQTHHFPCARVLFVFALIHH
jgi:hypothetical protein